MKLFVISEPFSGEGRGGPCPLIRLISGSRFQRFSLSSVRMFLSPSEMLASPLGAGMFSRVVNLKWTTTVVIVLYF